MSTIIQPHEPVLTSTRQSVLKQPVLKQPVLNYSNHPQVTTNIEQY